MKKIQFAMAALVVLSSVLYANEEAKPSAPVEKTKNPVVKMATSKGEILIELNAAKAPITVNNFLEYIKTGFFNGTIFHRVIPGFMIQGGGFSPDMQQKNTNPPIKNESYNHLRNKRGTIAMARTKAPDSATSQFYINHVDNRNLDFDGPMKPGYAVFGKVIQGMDVVDAIAAVPTTRVGPHPNVPSTPVVIESVIVVNPAKEEHPKGHDEHKDHDKDDHGHECEGDHDKSVNNEKDTDK